MQPWRRTLWTLHEWIDRAWTLEHNPRASREAYAACDRHIGHFPADLVAVELDADVLMSLQKLLMHSRRFGRPQRSYRAGHWTTGAIMDTNNQLARLNRIARRNIDVAGEMCSV